MNRIPQLDGTIVHHGAAIPLFSSRRRLLAFALVLASAAATGCDDDDPTGPLVRDPVTAPRVAVDRFSAAAGTLFERTVQNGLPGPNIAIDFDKAPFIVEALGPDGQHVSYYNFDVQPVEPAPIYVFFREGENTPVPEQINVIDVLPGQPGYNDFWQVTRVDVPQDYVANTVTSLAAILAAGYPRLTTNILVNCPVVPVGSTATHRVAGPTGITQGWYRDSVVSYFSFEERALMATGTGTVPVSVLFATFNINPGQPGGGFPSGFRTEPGTQQTHNVVTTLPAEALYSSLHALLVYDTDDFAAVTDLASALTAALVDPAPALVLANTPVARIQ